MNSGAILPDSLGDESWLDMVNIGETSRGTRAQIVVFQVHADGY